ncbi:hypothetical protein [Geodermatophilus sp. SYSU D00815]
MARLDHPCGLCGSHDVVLTESRAVRRGPDRLDPAFRPGTRVHELCRRCGAKTLIADSQLAG